ncbi:hypothetical protein [Chitinophaga barathri]|uniref:Uncharacterized protein n=1 Tax=Chitinophaga barathri TaxID=1647451 RepID=A0A3N4MFZ4_9BACT|nr:hypothetical protein [Chitinophaga barathri]RPD40607.1 hypothetical protein EG028_15015 [Chitinophaga barathri]
MSKRKGRYYPTQTKLKEIKQSPKRIMEEALEDFPIAELHEVHWMMFSRAIQLPDEMNEEKIRSRAVFFFERACDLFVACHVLVKRRRRKREKQNKQ